MYCQTLVSHDKDPAAAIAEFRAQLPQEKLAVLVCYYTEEYDAEALKEGFSTHFPAIPVHGASSCQAVMTETGYHKGPVVAVLAIYDSHSNAYGTGLASHLGDSVTESVNLAIDEALEQADRVGEVPSLILMHATPGLEEDIITTIDQRFGTLVPLIGGSSADNTIAERWSVFNNNAVTTHGISITVFFSSKSIYTAFSAGHTSTGVSGIATKVDGRKLLEIDGQPALDVYRSWANLYSEGEEDDNFIFRLASAYPIGRVAGYIYDQPYFKLTHPIRGTDEGGIEIFTSLDEGDELFLMMGCKDKLINRAARVVNAAYSEKLEESEKIGVINIFCAGPMLSLKQDIQSVCEQINKELDGKPFICPFTFGEQGRFVGGENGHGNLMISSAIFHKPYE